MPALTRVVADTPGLALLVSQRLIVPALRGIRLSATGPDNREAPSFTLITQTLSPLVIARAEALVPASCAEISAPLMTAAAFDSSRPSG